MWMQECSPSFSETTGEEVYLFLPNMIKGDWKQSVLQIWKTESWLTLLTILQQTQPPMQWKVPPVDCLVSPSWAVSVSITLAVNTRSTTWWYPQWTDFCQRPLQQHAVNPGFPSQLLFVDAGFTQNRITNLHNSLTWADKKLHTRHQNPLSINVQAGVLGDRLISPYYLLQRWTGRSYLNITVNTPPVLL
jgi:hypothetical protein